MMNKNVLNDKYIDIVNEILKLKIDASKGLPEELFLLVSALTPIPNVDLLIQDIEGRILLSWRDDEYYGKGWHIPGGCIRFGEKIEDRIQKTAIEEIGCNVEFQKEPLAIKDVIVYPNHALVNPNIRGHNITILYKCVLPKTYCIDNQDKIESDRGYLKWFNKIPNDLLKVHDVYKEIFENNNLY